MRWQNDAIHPIRLPTVLKLKDQGSRPKDNEFWTWA
jgi:hypothetical protein